MMMTIQRVHKAFSAFEIARKYYKILFILNDIKVPEKEISLVAFSSLNGSLTSPPIRTRFIEQFDSSEGSVYNMMSNLQSRGILIKDEDRKIRVNPVILLAFQEGLYLQILMSNEANTNHKEIHSVPARSVTEGSG